MSDPPNGELMRQLATAALADGRPLDWYEDLYTSGEVPWDHGEPTPLLVDWLEERLAGATGRGRAVVVGCAYGDDAELVAAHGFDTTAFDISPSAVHRARERHPASTVRYEQADLLDLPSAWRHAYDLVIECTTLQCLPPELHEQAAAGVASLCATGGTILVIARMPSADDPPGPPWLLSEAEVRGVAVGGVVLTGLERVPMRGGTRWRVTLNRPDDHGAGQQR